MAGPPSPPLPPSATMRALEGIYILGRHFYPENTSAPILSSSDSRKTKGLSPVDSRCTTLSVNIRAAWSPYECMNVPYISDRSGKLQINVCPFFQSHDRLLRGTIVNRTYGKHKSLYVNLFLPTIFGPIYYGPP